MKASFRLDVYSAPTIDHEGGFTRKGGPGFYAALALYAVAHDYEVHMACLGEEGDYLDPLSWEPVPATTHFGIHEEGGRRRLRLLQWRRLDALYAPKGDYALFSPVYWELQSHSIRMLTLYKFSVVDLQGYARLAAPDGDIVFEADTAVAIAVEAMSLLGPRVIVKAGIEDLGEDSVLLSHLLESAERSNSSLVVTMGSAGAAAAWRGGCAAFAPPKKSRGSIGAGDMLAALTLYGIHLGMELGEALGAAVSAVSCILERLDEGHLARAVCRGAFRAPPGKRTLCGYCCLGLAAPPPGGERGYEPLLVDA